jgi:hypothetical protein
MNVKFFIGETAILFDGFDNGRRKLHFALFIRVLKFGKLVHIAPFCPAETNLHHHK